MSHPLISELCAVLGRRNVLWAPSELEVYDCDALTVHRRRPAAVVFPQSTEQVAAVLKLCRRHGTAVVARGAGTGLAGGCTPDSGGAVVLALTRLNKILEIDLRNSLALVEAGVTNLKLTQAVQKAGFHFAPDPSSQNSATIGGNAATNAGGPHTLKYGVTVNHVLGLEIVLADGSIVQLGPVENPIGPDLIGAIVGSEGTLAVITKLWVRLTPNPQAWRTLQATFASVEDAVNAVSEIIASGIIPAALELMDAGILRAVDEAYHFGFPPDIAALLIVELDGMEVALDRQERQAAEILGRHAALHVSRADSAAERELLWKCRKMAVGAVGRLSSSYLLEDGVVPRTQLAHMFRRTAEISRKFQVRIVNVAHAGDGNLHPILLFDERDPAERERVLAAGREILLECIACGGSITAEHGIGKEKLSLMSRLFVQNDLRVQERFRAAFDPLGTLNPGKLIPRSDGEGASCGISAAGGA